ncbi:MAG: twin-arginine translocation signal domain-containing protein, partial [Phycisphaerae bacterium]
MTKKRTEKGIDRRSFLRSTAAVGAGLAFAPMVVAQTDTGKKPDDINVALLGAGQQGRTLMEACLRIPGIRFRAVCDIWESW